MANELHCKERKHFSLEGARMETLVVGRVTPCAPLVKDRVPTRTEWRALPQKSLFIRVHPWFYSSVHFQRRNSGPRLNSPFATVPHNQSV
jgi:hypothetical protein